MDVKKIYEYALQREREGYVFFSTNAEKVSHAAAAGVFRRLAEEEQQHIAYIEDLITGLDADPGAVEAPALQEDGWFEKRAEEELLQQTIIESMIPDVAILRTAYLIERDLAEFYRGAAERVEGPARIALSNLADWEKTHEKLFGTLHDRVFAEYSNMPWGG